MSLQFLVIVNFKLLLTSRCRVGDIELQGKRQRLQVKALNFQKLSIGMRKTQSWLQDGNLHGGRSVAEAAAAL